MLVPHTNNFMYTPSVTMYCISMKLHTAIIAKTSREEVEEITFRVYLPCDLNVFTVQASAC